MKSKRIKDWIFRQWTDDSGINFVKVDNKVYVEADQILDKLEDIRKLAKGE